MARFDLRVGGDPIGVTSDLRALVSQSSNIALDVEELSFDEKSDKYIINTVKEESTTDKHHGEQINNNFCQPIDANKDVAGSVFEEDGVTYI